MTTPAVHETRADGHLDETTVALFIERRLDRRDRDRVEHHIDGCAGCRALVAALGRGLGEGDRAPVDPDAPTLAAGTARPDDPAAPDQPALAIGSRVGRYVVVGTLGRGAMGAVYSALDPDLDRKVAVKLLRRGAAASDDARARLVREAQALAKLSHPSVIAVHDVGTHAGQTFVAMELVEAGTLGTWLRAEPRTPRDIVAVMVEVGRGLAAAHAAGLVHRDVKPDNVLVGADHRARISDFGLAIAVAAGDAPTGAAPAMTRSALGEPLTATGMTVGTPAYMAPEQVFGGAVTARSDQFSFCVTLFEALHGARPFPGATMEAIADAMRAGRVVDPPAPRRGVPAAVERALRRGLAIVPDDRFADMTALVAALTAGRSRRSRLALLAAGAGGVAAIAIAVVIAARGEAPAPRCTGFAAQLAGAWDPARRTALDTALRGADRAYAPAAAVETARVLDGYATGWIAARTDACEATHVRGDQSERLLDLRMRCLDRRRAELAGLVTALTAGGADAVARAVDAATALEPVAGCADVVALEARPAPPVDPVQRAAIARMSDDLVAARSQHAIGNFKGSTAIAARIVDEARAAGAREVEAEALLLEGQVTYRQGDAAAADPLLRDAAWAAEAVHRDDVAARARIAHVATAVGMASFPAAHDRIGAATAAVERAGATVLLRKELASQEGLLAAAEGDYAGARDRFAAALALAIELHGAEHLAVARALNNLANAKYSLGLFAEARADHERALAIRREALGDDHPDVATSRINLAHDLSQEGAAEDALVHYREGLRVLEATLGADNPKVATVVSDIGTELETLGKLSDALAFDRRAVDILDRRGKSPEAALAHENLAGVLDTLGRPSDALAEHQLGLTLRTELLGPDHPDVAQSLTNMGTTLLTLGKLREARTALDRALAIKTATLGADHVRLAPTLIAIGRVELARDRAAAAVAPLDRARVLLAGGAPLDLAACQVFLARALLASGKPADARRHASAAAETYAAANKPGEADEARALAR